MVDTSILSRMENEKYIMKNFSDAFDYLLGIEGKYSNHPEDPGGETMYGITARVARSNGYAGPMKDLPLGTAKQIAKKEYWDKYQCDSFDIRIGYQIFDTAYNGGKPAQWLQQAVGAEVDGIIGIQTISSVRSMNPFIVLLRFLSYRLQYMTDLKIWPTFGKGWARRIAKNMDLAAS